MGRGLVGAGLLPPEARFPGAGLLVESLPWAFLGAAQALTLLRAARRPRSAALAGLWAMAGAVGGILTVAAVVLTTRPFYGALRGTLGEYGINAVQVAVLIATLYAAPTGSVLVRVFRRAEAGGRVA